MPTIRQYLTPYNHNKGRRGQAIKYIVVHYTAGSMRAYPAALRNCKFFASANRNASAHYFIDEGDTIYQSVLDEDTAWSVGAKKYVHLECRNYNSISIEVCSDGMFSEKEIVNLRWLVKKLQKKYGIPDDHVIRHFDVTGKSCPAYYVDGKRWHQLRERIFSNVSEKLDWQHKDGNTYLYIDGKLYKGERLVNAGDHVTRQFFDLKDGHLLKGKPFTEVKIYVDEWGAHHEVLVD